MNDTAKLILFFVVILVSNIIQAITGFAGTVLAMPFSIILVGGNTARVVLNILGIAASIGVVILNRRSINWRQVLIITPIMLVGMGVGFVIIHFAQVSKQILYFILAGFVLLFTAIGVYTTFIRKPKEPSLEEEPRSRVIAKEVFLYALLVVAGVVHGMFVCGGPLLIVYATVKLKDRDEFRSTLSMVWIVLNTVNLIRDIVAGAFNENMGRMMMTLGISLAVLIAALLVGNLVAKKLNKKVFMIITYVLMAISAVSLILNACGVF
ncbi:MAG: sulfite exporter TauE/SafE family protein [Clostridia bacterium]|nr:sulfite exporter TauE/SafE family protein [Clostridia bacterium]